MASSLTRGVKCVAKSSSSSVSAGWEWLLVLRSSSKRCYAAAKAKASSSSSNGATMRESSIPSSEKEEDLEDLVPTSGISRPLSEILKELNKKVPDSLIRVRTESDGFPVKYIPWHIVNRIMNLHAPEWSGEVRSITYSADGKSVSVVYHVTLYGTDAEIYKESTGTVPVNDAGYGDPVQKAEANGISSSLCPFWSGTSSLSRGCVIAKQHGLCVRQFLV